MITLNYVLKELCAEIQTLGNAWGEIPVELVLITVAEFSKSKGECVITPISAIEFEEKT